MGSKSVKMSWVFFPLVFAQDPCTNESFQVKEDKYMIVNHEENNAVSYLLNNRVFDACCTCHQITINFLELETV